MINFIERFYDLIPKETIEEYKRLVKNAINQILFAVKYKLRINKILINYLENKNLGNIFETDQNKSRRVGRLHKYLKSENIFSI